MFRYHKLKYLSIKNLLPDADVHKFICTCRINENKANIFIQAIKNLDGDSRVPVFDRKVFLQTIGSGSYGAPQALFVQSHFHRFLFNCGEGTRRICEEQSLGISKLSNIFFTSCSWPNASGIPTFHAAFTFDEKKKSEFFNFYGPSDMKNFLDLYGKINREFYNLSSFNKVNSHEVIFKDSLVVKPVPLYASDSKDNLSNYILAYICTFPARRGSVCLSKLVAAGVPPGPLVEVLKNGTPVKLPNSKIVTPLEVSKYYHKSSSFIVLDIPSSQYLDALISNSEFDKYKVNKREDTQEEENNLKIIVHFSPSKVMKDSRYRLWVNSFPPSVCHLAINDRSSCLGLCKPIEMQLQLNQIFPDVFPLHLNPGVPFVNSKFNGPYEKKPSKPLLLTSEYKFDGPTVQSDTSLLFHFRPFLQFDNSLCPYVNPNEALEYIKEKQIVKLGKDVEGSKQEKNSSEHPNVLFLGTGSAKASCTRNVSGILLTLSSQSCVLLDCGEGTLNQLIRFMGKNLTVSTLRKLKLIFISHKHQDHHMGLITLLIERRNAFLEAGIEEPPPLYIFTPLEIMNFIENIFISFAIDLQNIILINNANIVVKKRKMYYYYDAIKSLQLKDISVVHVPHTKNSFGIALTHSDDWKIVYSGDCKPSLDLINIGKNCDLLIHEATLEDGMEEDAREKRHCTVSQALQVAKDMKAKFTILTHFSQRYYKLPFLDESIFQENVGIAFDFMKVTFEDIPHLRHLYPLLKEIYKEDFYELKMKNYRRNLK